jgi:hypothetical protein
MGLGLRCGLRRKGGWPTLVIPPSRVPHPSLVSREGWEDRISRPQVPGPKLPGGKETRLPSIVPKSLVRYQQSTEFHSSPSAGGWPTLVIPPSRVPHPSALFAEGWEDRISRPQVPGPKLPGGKETRLPSIVPKSLVRYQQSTEFHFLTFSWRVAHPRNTTIEGAPSFRALCGRVGGLNLPSSGSRPETSRRKRD